MTGIDVFTYWGTSLLWDLFVFLVVILVVIIVVVSCEIDNWSSHGGPGLLFVVLFVFAIAVLPMTYVFSLLFKSPGIGILVEFLINILTGEFLFASRFVSFNKIDKFRFLRTIGWLSNRRAPVFE